MNITQDEVMKRIEGLDADTQRSMVCAMVGHSRIITTCFGYVYCARCEAQVGDTLAGAKDLREAVIVGHACPTCHENAKALTWQDTLLTPEPFPEKG